MFIIIKILSEQQGHIWSNIKQVARLLVRRSNLDLINRKVYFNETYAEG